MREWPQRFGRVDQQLRDMQFAGMSHDRPKWQLRRQWILKETISVFSQFIQALWDPVRASTYADNLSSKRKLFLEEKLTTWDTHHDNQAYHSTNVLAEEDNLASYDLKETKTNLQLCKGHTKSVTGPFILLLKGTFLNYCFDYHAIFGTQLCFH